MTGTVVLGVLAGLGAVFVGAGLWRAGRGRYRRAASISTSMFTVSPSSESGRTSVW